MSRLKSTGGDFSTEYFIIFLLMILALILSLVTDDGNLVKEKLDANGSVITLNKDNKMKNTHKEKK